MDWSVGLHVGAALAAAGAALALTIAGAVAALGGSVRRRSLDRILLAGILGALVAIASGPLLLAGGRTLADPLHALYATVVLLAGPVSRGAAMRDTVLARASRRLASPGLGRWTVAGGLTTLGALLRLWMTGG